jgi:hypothetical protein
MGSAPRSALAQAPPAAATPFLQLEQARRLRAVARRLTPIHILVPGSDARPGERSPGSGPTHPPGVDQPEKEGHDRRVPARLGVSSPVRHEQHQRRDDRRRLQLVVSTVENRRASTIDYWR